MKKKLLSLALALSLCLGLSVPTSAYYSFSTPGRNDTITACSPGLSPSATFAVIKPDNSLWMWGDNRNGQLWDKTESYGSKTPLLMMNDVLSVNSGLGYFAVIKTDHSLWMWGNNSRAQLGNGTTEDSHVPVKVMEDVASVSCSYYRVAAVKTDGSLWVWGDNNQDRLGFTGGNMAISNLTGIPTTMIITGPVEEKMTPIQSVPKKLMDGVTAVSCNDDITAAVKTDGSLWVWGNNYYGKLGLGTHGDRSVHPTKLMDGVASVSCGNSFTAAVKTDGSLWTWGENTDGQLGNGRVADLKSPYRFIYQTSPTKVADNVSAVYCLYNSMGIIKKDNSLWMCGMSSTLGQGPEGSSDFTDIRYPDQKNLPPVETRLQTVPVKTMDNVVEMAFTSSKYCVVKTDGSLWMWGYDGSTDNSWGLGKGTVPYPTQIAGITVKLPNSGSSANTPVTPTTPSKPSNFSDVKDGDWFKPYVDKATEAGLMNGIGNGKFDPQGNATNAQLMVLAYQMHSKENGTSLPKVDGAWYAPYAQYCKDHALSLNSLDPDPTDTATRFDMVSILHKAIPASRLEPVNPNVTVPDLSATAYGPVYQWYRAGILSGDAQGNFNGTNNITRAEIAVILCQINNLM